MKTLKKLLVLLPFFIILTSCNKSLELTDEEKEYLNHAYSLSRIFLLSVEDFENYYAKSGEKSGEKMFIFILSYPTLMATLKEKNPPENFKETHTILLSGFEEMGKVAVGYPKAYNQDFSILNELDDMLEASKQSVQEESYRLEKMYEMANLNNEMVKIQKDAIVGYERVQNMAN